MVTQVTGMQAGKSMKNLWFRKVVYTGQGFVYGEIDLLCMEGWVPVTGQGFHVWKDGSVLLIGHDISIPYYPCNGSTRSQLAWPFPYFLYYTMTPFPLTVLRTRSGYGRQQCRFLIYAGILDVIFMLL